MVLGRDLLLENMTYADEGLSGANLSACKPARGDVIESVRTVYANRTSLSHQALCDSTFG